MQADLLERVRRYSFMIVMGITVMAGYLLVPPFGAPYTSFVIGSHRGFYNSPWVGTLYGVVTCTLLALVGFYLVKNTVQRDDQTMVGQIIAATPIRKPFYTLGKWLSNLAVLVLILLALSLIAPIMQYVRAEDTSIELWALVAPIWIMGLPALAVVSAIAVLFECIPFLRGGLGNVVYFFIWGPVLVGSTIGSATDFSLNSTPRNDFAGLSRTLISIYQSLDAGGYDASYGVTGVIGPVMGEKITRFNWDGISWTADMLLERLMWLGGAAAIALAASIPFDRFDPACSKLLQRQRKRKHPPEASQDRTEQNGLFTHAEYPTQTVYLTQPAISNSTLKLQNFWLITFAELRLMLKGLHWVWYIVSIGLIVACLFSPLQIVQRHLLPIAWVLPILIWSQMGTREKNYDTWQIIFSTANPIRCQLPAMWFAGVVIAVITGSGAIIRFASYGAWMNLFAWIVGALLIPALAFSLGVWSGSRRLFELVYLFWWYLAYNGLVAWDFIGITPDALERGNPWLFLGLIPILLAASVFGRWRQLRG